MIQRLPRSPWRMGDARPNERQPREESTAPRPKPDPRPEKETRPREGPIPVVPERPSEPPRGVP